MAIGGGILPSTGSSQFTELTYVTRRAFIPKMVVQIYNSTPLMAALIANSQTATGGVSSVTVPVQGAQFVNASGRITAAPSSSRPSSRVLTTLSSP